MKEYSSITLKSILSELEKHELGHIQALLLLTLVDVGLEDWSTAWMVSGQAVRLVTGIKHGSEPNEQ